MKSLGSNSPAVEAYRSLRADIQFTNIEAETRTIVVTSTGPGEGKSSVASNLAS